MSTIAPALNDLPGQRNEFSFNSLTQKADLLAKKVSDFFSENFTVCRENQENPPSFIASGYFLLKSSLEFTQTILYTTAILISQFTLDYFEGNASEYLGEATLSKISACYISFKKSVETFPIGIKNESYQIAATITNWASSINECQYDCTKKLIDGTFYRNLNNMMYKLTGHPDFVAHQSDFVAHQSDFVAH
ncbi:MAG: hypothetical protein EBU93_06865 [Chlamydiae bacterium]|nr:hypothetical protein [Chlamydiota bacterium]